MQRTKFVYVTCDGCGQDCLVLYKEDGTQDVAVGCNNHSNMHPQAGQPSMEEWLKEIEQIQDSDESVVS